MGVEIGNQKPSALLPQKSDQPSWVKEVAKEKQKLTPYSFRHRYAYYGHNRPKADGSYRAPKQVADAMGHTLYTHLLSYSRFQTKDLASAFDETTLLVKTAA